MCTDVTRAGGKPQLLLFRAVTAAELEVWRRAIAKVAAGGVNSAEDDASAVENPQRGRTRRARTRNIPTLADRNTREPPAYPFITLQDGVAGEQSAAETVLAEVARARQAAVARARQAKINDGPVSEELSF